MPGQFDSAIWPPTPIPESTKKLISRLFDVCDTNDPTNGVHLAEEVFTPEAQFVTVNGTFAGKDVDKIYPGDKEGNELILTGKLETRTKNGQGTTVTDFAARGIVDPSGPRLKLWQAYIGNSSTA